MVRAIPLDLVLCIAAYCPQSELSLLAALNKSCHTALVLMLYHNIHLVQAKKIVSFCNTINTGQPLLRSCPKSIHIELSQAPSSDSESLGQPLRNMLSLVLNLSDLTLLVPDDVASDILDPSLDHSFMLTRLTIRVTPGPGFLDFLKRQEHIEDIIFKEDMIPEPQRRMEDLSVLVNLDPKAMPLLKSADGYFLFFRRLARNRSLKVANIRGPVPQFLFTAIAETLAPLTCLRIDLAIRERVENEVIGAMVALESLGGSLKELSLWLFILGWNNSIKAVSSLELLGSSNTPSHGLDEIRQPLSSFTALRSFELNSSLVEGLPSQLCPTVPELSQLEPWRKSCPTLRRVSIFGVILLAE